MARELRTSCGMGIRFVLVVDIEALPPKTDVRNWTRFSAPNHPPARHGLAILVIVEAPAPAQLHGFEHDLYTSGSMDGEHGRVPFERSLAESAALESLPDGAPSASRDNELIVNDLRLK